MALLELSRLHKKFGGLHAVNDVSFTVEKGAIKSVIGPNGAGKTTLFNLITGSLNASSGSATFEGKELLGKKPHQIATYGMARTFQNIKLFHDMSVLENVMVGRHIRSRSGFMASMLHVPWMLKEDRQIRDKSLEFLDLLGMADSADTEISNLSFGQQRGVEFARALATEPTLLLLDEPAAGLNIYETAEIGRLIMKIRESGITVLLVEHDMSLVMDISDEIVVLSFGEKIAEDLPQNIQQNEEVIRIYLGDEE